MKLLRVVSMFIVAGALLAAPASAQTGAAEVSGTVVDQDGNPVKGAKVTFAPKAIQTLSYDAKTNKKGKYWAAGLYTSHQDNEWLIGVEFEGYIVTKILVESRTANKTLIAPPFEKRVRPGQDIPSIRIRKLGIVKVDFIVTQEDMVSIAQPVAPVAVPEGETPAAVDAPAAVPQKDPWDEALRLAGAGDTEAAAPLFLEAIDKEPESAERRETAAKIFYQLERYDSAAEQAAKAIELQPSGVDSRMVLYSVHVAQGDLDQARTTLEAAREVVPESSRVLKQLAYVATQQGRTDDALQVYEELIEFDPENTDAWLAMAEIYAALGDDAKTEAAYQNVVELDPSNAHQVFYNLGVLKLKADSPSDADRNQAVAAFRKAIEINPNYSQAHKQLAFALLGMGDRSGAKGSLEQYVKISPDAADAAQIQRMIETLR